MTGRYSGKEATVGNTARRRDPTDWPQQRPTAWRLLARFDKNFGFSRLFDTGRDAILLYHSVGGIPGAEYDWDLTEAEFRAQIEMVCDRFEPVDLAELVDGRDANADTERVAVTFDDGFRNVYGTAMPVLSEFDVPATVFVCPGLLGDENLDVVRERHDLGPEAHDITLTEEQVREIAAEDLFSIGNHTDTHTRLSDLEGREAVVEEVLGGKERLETVTGGTVDRFSYPYGGSDARAADVVAASHELAVTSRPGLVEPSPNPYRLPRIDTCLPIECLRFETTGLGDRLRRAARRFGGLVS